MQRFLQWFQGILMRPQALVALIAVVTVIAIMTTILAFAVAGSPVNAVPGSGTTPAQTGNVNVALNDNRIESSQATFTPGMRYHFTVVNRGSVHHEFMILPVGMGMGSMPMDQLDHLALARTGDMAPGMTKNVDYTFMSSLAGQRPEFGCYYPGHDLMRLQISVTQ